jgi:hypothetical protein
MLFFLWYGLAAFVPAFNPDMFKKIGAVLAPGYAAVECIGLLGDKRIRSRKRPTEGGRLFRHYLGVTSVMIVCCIT